MSADHLSPCQKTALRQSQTSLYGIDHVASSPAVSPRWCGGIAAPCSEHDALGVPGISFPRGPCWRACRICRKSRQSTLAGEPSVGRQDNAAYEPVAKNLRRRWRGSHARSVALTLFFSLSGPDRTPEDNRLKERRLELWSHLLKQGETFTYRCPVSAASSRRYTIGGLGGTKPDFCPAYRCSRLRTPTAVPSSRTSLSGSLETLCLRACRGNNERRPPGPARWADHPVKQGDER